MGDRLIALLDCAALPLGFWAGVLHFPFSSVVGEDRFYIEYLSLCYRGLRQRSGYCVW
jgi:hypothetical protein